MCVCHATSGSEYERWNTCVAHTHSWLGEASHSHGTPSVTKPNAYNVTLYAYVVSELNLTSGSKLERHVLRD